MKYIFLAGVHAVGKSTLLNRINESYPIVSSSVSDLIRKAGKAIPQSEKRTNNIVENQQLWKQELENFKLVRNQQLILDGHFSLLDTDGDIKELSFDTFEGTNMIKIILKKEDPKIIKQRLYYRDKTDWDIKKLELFQMIEEEQAKRFSINKNIPLFIYDQDGLFNDVVKFIKY